jgi:predicted Zn finger-like uncharacterized protein
MILSCPSCSTRYLVADAALTPKGRQVRCSRCRHTWFQEGPRAPPPEPVFTVDLIDPPPPVGWLALGLVVALIGAGGYWGRPWIVDYWPPAAKLYQAAGLQDESPGAGLEFRNVVSERRREGEKFILVIEGSVTNVGDRPRDVPMLRVALRGADRVELHHWMFRTSVETLMPGESATFQTQLDREVPGAASFAVTFGPAIPRRG